MTKYATEEWERRCTAVLETEKQNGIHERNIAAGKQKWALQVEGPQQKRGRPPKDPSDLCLAYRRTKESKAKKQELMEVHGVAAGASLHREWIKARLEEEREGKRTVGTKTIRTMLTEHLTFVTHKDQWV